MPNILDSVIANESLQQTSAPPCRPCLFIWFLEPLQLPTKHLVIKLRIGALDHIPCLMALPSQGKICKRISPLYHLIGQRDNFHARTRTNMIRADMWRQDGAICSKNRKKLSHIMGTNGSQDLRSPSPIMAIPTRNIFASPSRKLRSLTVSGSQRKTLQVVSKSLTVILMLDNLKKVDSLQFLWITN